MCPAPARAFRHPSMSAFVCAVNVTAFLYSQCIPSLLRRLAAADETWEVTCITRLHRFAVSPKYRWAG
jgi:hypothetical protein